MSGLEAWIGRQEWLCRFIGHRPVRGRPYPNFVVIWCARCRYPMSEKYRLLPLPPGDPAREPRWR